MECFTWSCCNTGFIEFDNRDRIWSPHTILRMIPLSLNNQKLTLTYPKHCHTQIILSCTQTHSNLHIASKYMFRIQKTPPKNKNNINKNAIFFLRLFSIQQLYESEFFMWIFYKQFSTEKELCKLIKRTLRLFVKQFGIK